MYGLPSSSCAALAALAARSEAEAIINLPIAIPSEQHSRYVNFPSAIKNGALASERHFAAKGFSGLGHRKFLIQLI